MTKTINRKKHPYYNFDKLFSFNAMISCVSGGRGIGKTYGALVFGINQYLKHGTEFIYLRRYKPEIVNSKLTFFNAVADEFPDYDFRVTGQTGEMAHVSTRDDNKRQWHTICYFATLAGGQSRKGSSFHNVTLIIFDEFLVERGAQYLPDESNKFLSFLDTVERYQDKTRVIMLSNAVSIMNPYFISWGVDPQQAIDGFVKLRNGELVCHFPDSKEFKDSIYESRFGRFIKGTEYADYAIENEFADNTATLIEEKDPGAKYVFTLTTSKGRFSIWHSIYTDEIYAQRKLPKAQKHYTTEPERVSRTMKLVQYRDPKMNVLRASFNRGAMTFDHPSTRNAFTDVFKR